MTTLRMLATYAIIAALGLALSSSFITGVHAANPHPKGGSGATTVNCTIASSGDAITCGQASFAGLGNAQSAVLRTSITQEFRCTDSFDATANFAVSSNPGNTVFQGGTSPLQGGNPSGCSPLTLLSTTAGPCTITFYTGTQGSGDSLGSVGCTIA